MIGIKETLFLLAVDSPLKIDINGDEKTSVQNVPTLSGDAVLSGVLNAVYYFVGVAAVIAIIVGGILYATSSGDANGIKKAKDLIVYAVVGLVVVIMAFIITGFIMTRVG